MPVNRNLRTYPLALRAASDYPINQGIVAAYDYAGNPNNAYAGGNGAPHVGTQTLTRSTVATLVSLNGGEILARDTSDGKTANAPYDGLSVGKLGFGTDDGKGAFTIHRRYRVPTAYSGTSSNRLLARYRDANDSLSFYMVESISNPWCFFFVELNASTVSLPTSSTRTTNAAFRIPYGSIADIHLVREGDQASLYLNGAFAASLAIPNFVLRNTNWGGVSGSTPDGVSGGQPTDMLLIDQTIWNRALTAAEVATHRSDPYAGYVNSASVPVATAPAKPTAVIATGGQNTVTVNGTPGADGGAVVTGYTARIFSAANNTLLGSGGDSSLPVTISAIPAGSVYATLSATNMKGEGPQSDASNTVQVTNPPPPPDPDPTPVRTPIRFDFPAFYEIFAASTDPVTNITSVTISPDAVTMEGGAVRQFNADVQGVNSFDPTVTWSCTAGAINSFGTFTAPPATDEDQQILVRATSVQDANKWDEAVVTILALEVEQVTSVQVSPLTAQMSGNTQLQMEAVVNGPLAPSQEVTWSASAGEISSFGLLTAPPTQLFEQIIKVRATSVQNPAKWGEATITVPARAVVTSVAVAPTNVSINGGVSFQFTADVQGQNGPSTAVNWGTTIGEISADGVLVAPTAKQTAQTGIVTATSAFDPTKYGTAIFTVPAEEAPPEPETRTVSLVLGEENGPAANLSGLMVSFHAASGPHATGLALYQSSTETTDGTGRLTFSMATSVLQKGDFGVLSVLMPDGRHFLGRVAVG